MGGYEAAIWKALFFYYTICVSCGEAGSCDVPAWQGAAVGKLQHRQQQKQILSVSTHTHTHLHPHLSRSTHYHPPPPPSPLAVPPTLASGRRLLEQLTYRNYDMN